MQVSNIIRTIRQRALLTQEQFAHEVGVSTSTIIRWETGKVLPNINGMKAIKAYCAAHGFPYESLEELWVETRLEDK